MSPSIEGCHAGCDQCTGGSGTQVLTQRSEKSGGAPSPSGPVPICRRNFASIGIGSVPPSSLSAHKVPARGSLTVRGRRRRPMSGDHPGLSAAHRELAEDPLRTPSCLRAVTHPNHVTPSPLLLTRSAERRVYQSGDVRTRPQSGEKRGLPALW